MYMDELFGKYGRIKDYHPGDQIECTLDLPAPIDTSLIRVPYEVGEDSTSITIRGSNAIDFLGEIYKTSSKHLDDPKYWQFLHWINSGRRLPRCLFFKKLPEAVIPGKRRTSDVGYDLTVVKKVAQLTETTALYDTGIAIQLDTGYYADVVARSSLSKTGYIFTNGVGVIDPSYTGSILIALTKIDRAAPDVELPFRCCQLLVRRQVHVDVAHGDVLPETDRASGGFGSTGSAPAV